MLWDLLPANVWLLVAFAALGSFVYGFAGFGSGLVGIPLALQSQDCQQNCWQSWGLS